MELHYNGKTLGIFFIKFSAFRKIAYKEKIKYNSYQEGEYIEIRHASNTSALVKALR